MSTEHPWDHRRLSEAEAHRILARAAELDSQASPSDLSLAQLREIAVEAGISPDALTAALAEAQGESAHPLEGRSRAATAMPAQQEEQEENADDRRVPMGQRWRDLHRDAPTAAKRGTTTALIANVAAMGAFWLALKVLAGSYYQLDPGEAHWIVRKWLDPVAGVFGVALARRLRARTALVLLGGFAVATAAEVAMDMVKGTPAIRGALPHLALFAAGIGGVLAGHVLSRHEGRHGTRAGRSRRSPEPSQSSAAAATRSREGLTPPALRLQRQPT